MQVWYVPDGQMMLEMAESLVTMAGHQRKVSSGQLEDNAKGKIYLSWTHIVMIVLLSIFFNIPNKCFCSRFLKKFISIKNI